MTRVYFIGDMQGMSHTESMCVDVSFNFPINYRALRRVLIGKRVAIAIDDSSTFTRLDGGFCEEGIYDVCNADVCECPHDFEYLYERRSPDIVLTDAINFARSLKWGKM